MLKKRRPWLLLFAPLLGCRIIPLVLLFLAQLAKFIVRQARIRAQRLLVSPRHEITARVVASLVIDPAPLGLCDAGENIVTAIATGKIVTVIGDIAGVARPLVHLPTRRILQAPRSATGHTRALARPDVIVVGRGFILLRTMRLFHQSLPERNLSLTAVPQLMLVNLNGLFSLQQYRIEALPSN